MENYLLILIGTVFVNNIVMSKILGLCPFMGVSKKLETALGMGAATTFVLTLATAATWLEEVGMGLHRIRPSTRSGSEPRS